MVPFGPYRGDPMEPGISGLKCTHASLGGGSVFLLTTVLAKHWLVFSVSTFSPILVPLIFF